MNIDSKTGLLNEARFVASPNFNERPDGTEIYCIVIHNISLPPGEFGGADIEALFTNQLDPSAHPFYAAIANTPVSSHLLIRRDGDCDQYVPFGKRAWHAGNSELEGKCDCNNYSIGIELEGTDSLPYTDAQYHCLAKIAKLLIMDYPGIKTERIVGHCDIAPGRKTDPGPSFDWQRFWKLLK